MDDGEDRKDSDEDWNQPLDDDDNERAMANTMASKAPPSKAPVGSLESLASPKKPIALQSATNSKQKSDSKRSDSPPKENEFTDVASNKKKGKKPKEPSVPTVKATHAGNQRWVNGMFLVCKNVYMSKENLKKYGKNLPPIEKCLREASKEIASKIAADKN